MPQAKKPAAKKPAAKKTTRKVTTKRTTKKAEPEPTLKEQLGVPEEVVADSVRETDEPVAVDGNYLPLPVEHRLPDVSDLPEAHPDVHGEAAKLRLANKDEPTPTDTVKVGGEEIELVHSPTNVDPVVLGSQRYDTVLKDRARSQGKAHLVDTPEETKLGRQRAGEVDEVKLPGEPKPVGHSKPPTVPMTENEIRRGEEIAAQQEAERKAEKAAK